MSDLDALRKLPVKAEIIGSINNRYEELFGRNINGERCMLICSFCDEFILSKDELFYVKIDSLKKKKYLFDWKQHFATGDHEPVAVRTLKEQFMFPDFKQLKYEMHWLKDLCLSPRGIIGKKGKDGRSHYGFSSCKRCQTCISQNYTPLYAIVNQNHVGCAPMQLTELTPVELAFVTPVRGFGYCFNYAGGVSIVDHNT